MSFKEKAKITIKGSVNVKKSEIRFTVPTDIKNQLRINAIQANKTLNKYMLELILSATKNGKMEKQK